MEDPDNPTRILGRADATFWTAWLPGEFWDTHGDHMVGYQEPIYGAGTSHDFDRQAQSEKTKTHRSGIEYGGDIRELGQTLGGSRTGAGYSLPLIPIGNEFKEITEGWSDEKRQAYVDYLEDWLVLSGSYETKPEINILDIFDK